MANLTISVNSETLKRARLRALQENTSVNALLGQFLQEYADTVALRQQRKRALQDLLSIAAEHTFDRGERTWKRADLYER